MPGSSRRDIIREGEIATYHVWSQTALQRFLLGRDFGLKQNNEHRRAWCMSLAGYLERVFAVDIGALHPMDNHFHLILRTRPDLVAKLTDEEVAFRWRLAWPKYNEDTGEWYRYPTDADIRKLLVAPDKLLQVRANLSSVSWFVGRFKECLSKLANAEVGTKGHFWSERFGSRELVDDAAVFTGMLYTDLNQVRAGMAPSLLQSMYTTIQARLIESRLKEAKETLDMFHQREGEKLSITLAELQDIYLRCNWVAPIQPDGDLKLVNDAWSAYAHPGQNASDRTRSESCEPSPPVFISSPSADEKEAKVLTLSSQHLPADSSSEIPQEPTPTFPPPQQSLGERDVEAAEAEELQAEPEAEVESGEETSSELSLSVASEPDRNSQPPACSPEPMETEEISTESLSEAEVTEIHLPATRPPEEDSATRVPPHAKPNPASKPERPPPPPKVAPKVEAERAKELKAKIKSRAKANPTARTYEIHNRLFPQLPLRASNSPILAMPLEHYLRLAEAAAERALKLRLSGLSSDSVLSELPADLVEILRNLGIDCEEWYATLDAFHERFYYLVGAPKNVADVAARKGRQRVFGINACRNVFRDLPEPSGESSDTKPSQEEVACGPAPDRGPTPGTEFS